ncbi:growth arrest-specific protein 7 [Grus japonensis]|uniref:Growth arrest-specific protein 7 n=1 Tax=Grus japonensis TaxID=30415 RepID=A0ABC9XMV6_GRUJA
MSGSRCQTLYPFSGERHRQGLRFAAGELITVLQVPDGGWWEGQKEDGLRGWFPASYVQLLEKIKERTKAVVNVGQGRHREVKMFGTLWFLQAHSGGLAENSDDWRFLLMAMMETMRAGGGLEECV